MSVAVAIERVSKVVGYKLTTANFQTVGSNLPQRIAILGEANTAFQSGLATTPVQINSAKQAGTLFGYGSPIHAVARILFPIQSDGVGGIPVVVYPQVTPGGATSKKLTITPTGVATGNATHTVVIAGRTGVDAATYDFVVNTGDTTGDIVAKIEDAVNRVLGAPVTCTSDPYEAEVESKWKGLTANAITVTVDTGIDNVGITYAVTNTQTAAGTPSVAASLALFGSNWNTIVVNTYGTVTATMTELETYNGKPDDTTPTGRYAAIIMKPFIALTGSVAEDPSSITDSRSTQVTIAICPAPLSAGMQYEAAANFCTLYARQAQDTPHLDVQDMLLPDMPTPAAIGKMDTYVERDAIVKKGCSTVELAAGQYKICDFVTTYHPDGETPPQFRYVRNLNLDFNVRYGYYLLEQINVMGHVIAADDDIVDASNVVKPKTWKSVLISYAEDLTRRALITGAEFMQDSITVNLGTSNPDRFDTFFRYKRTGIARISSTEAQAGFNFGTVITA